MPKKSENPRIQREKAFIRILESKRLEKGITRDGDMARLFGIPQYTYSRYKKTSFDRVDWHRIAEWMHKLGATTEDWCAIGGFPYSEEARRDGRQ